MEMAGSSNAPDVSTLTQFMQASNINVSNFVSTKLSGSNNYIIWKAQMLCLIKSQVLLHIIDAKNPFPADKGVHMIEQYNELVKGWIFGSVNENVLKRLVDLGMAQRVWMKLESLFNPSVSDTEDDSVGFKFRIESARDFPEIENVDRRKRLYKAAIEGWWWEAKSILKIHRNATTDAITPNGNTILHVAVEMGHNYFLEKLLEFIKDGKDMEVVNDKGRTALHIAAMVGNTHTAQLLVQKRKQLLYIKDHDENLPFDIATTTMNHNISTYLFKSTPSPESVYSDMDPLFALLDAVITKQYDLAETLLKKMPTLDFRLGELILMQLTLTFPTDLGFKESLIYPSFHNVHRKTFDRCSLLFHPIFLEKYVDDILQLVKRCDNMILLVPLATLYPIYLLIFLIILVLRLTFSMSYFLLWKVLIVIVRPIKNIENKKKEYQEAKKVLNLICAHMGSLPKGYTKPLFEAIRQDTYEVVDEILFTSPASINCRDKEGYNVIQSAIVNRSGKVFNLIYHIIERTESYRTMKDSSYNNLAHLAGRLAPSFVLDRITGEALQLQQELLWHEEVKKLYRPIELTEENIHEETPDMVFTKEHQDLRKQGENWMKTTAESFSVIAALIITIVFAAAITVPGGSNQESGTPVFKKEIAFTIFALSDALSLFTATIALLLFLTTRFSYKDFLVTLPRMLIFGLLMLYLSTIGMIVAFCAILFLVFCDQRPWMLAPIAGCACLPISVIVAKKIPEFVDLIQSTYFPIFGKRSYLESCKVNRKSTIFTE